MKKKEKKALIKIFKNMVNEERIITYIRKRRTIIIENGVGDGRKARVDGNNQLHGT
jgi:hypothetical protein